MTPPSITLIRGADSAPCLRGENGVEIRYRDLIERVDRFAAQLGSARSLVVIAPENCVEAVVAYLACFCHGHVVMLIPPDQPEFLKCIEAIYSPNWIFTRTNEQWNLQRCSNEPVALHPDLAVLLSTSGTTGAIKFVQLSHDNLVSNADSIRQYLDITSSDRAMLSLPFHYSYGLSVLNSHLLAGASLILTERSVTERAFWELFKQEAATSLAGVPHTFELLDSIGFDQLSLPSLKTLTQAGGRLAQDKVIRYAQLAEARHWRFFVMYGQTEAAPRIAYVPPQLLLENPDCIGVAIPRGQLFLVDADGRPVGDEKEGELVYEGPNVMLGYATGREDLSKGRSAGRLHTGDLAIRKPNGLYRITGRKNRFLKLFGLRIGLDELEKFLTDSGYRAVCGGNDATLVVLTLDPGSAPGIARLLSERCKLPPGVIRVTEVSDFPVLPSGKIDYSFGRKPTPETFAVHRPEDGKSTAQRVHDVYATLFPGKEITANDSFASLGGDSLTFVEASMGLEDALGHLPENWHELTVATLSSTRRKQTRLHSIDTASLLRCVTIVAVVANHFGLFRLRGSVSLMMLLAGFGFARFQLERVIRTRSTDPILSLAIRIGLPVMVVIALLQGKAGEFSALQLALLGNWVGPGAYKFNYWFLELLVQIFVIVAAILYLPSSRASAEARPFMFALGLLAASVAAAVLIPYVWSSEYLYHRIPHMFLWLFFLGWLLHIAHAGTQRLVAITLLIVLPMLMTNWKVLVGETSPPWVFWVWGGGLMILFVEQVKCPYPLNKVVNTIAAASMFIFLMHYPGKLAFAKLAGPQAPIVDVVAGLASGILSWWLWETTIRRVQRWSSAKRKQVKTVQPTVAE